MSTHALRGATRLMIVCALMATTGACATRANSVAPVAISSSDFSTLTCEQLRNDLQGARAREDALAKKQNNAALADAASVFLFLLPLGSVFGADVSGDLAQAKGEVIALERSIRAKCAS